MKDFRVPRSLLVFGLCVPLAILLGYQLATPLEFTSLAFVGMCLGILSIPLLMKWHHPLLIFTSSSVFIVFFLPGQPSLGLVIACLSFGFSMLNRTLRRGESFLNVPSVTLPLVFLALVVFVTARVTGGIGGRAIGSEMWGGKRYLGVFGAVIGYFALTAQQIPPHRRILYASLFFLSGVTAVFSDLAYAAGPQFYFLFALIPPELAAAQAITQGTLSRLTGPTWAALALFFYMIARYGVGGMLDLRRPWRLLCLFLVVVTSLFGGYRSTLILMFCVFLAQFFFEGLFRSRLFPALLLVAAIGAVLLVAFVEKLPLSVQRSLSFLPIEVNFLAEHDAYATLDWRFQMWRIVLPEVPDYLLLGKGYAYSGTDYYLTQEAIRRGLLISSSWEDTLVSGNYHQGLLTIIIPFGIWGLIGFAWFCWSALRVLHRNYRYGDPSCQMINTFLIAYFVGRLLFYVIFYGQFDLDFLIFTGTVGLSISLNGGVRGPATSEVVEESNLQVAPA